jgi:hypothetical protein
MTDAEKRLWLKLRRKQLKGHPFYRQKIIGKYIVDFYPVRNNAPLGFESERLEFIKSPLTPLCQRGGKKGKTLPKRGREKPEMAHSITRRS